MTCPDTRGLILEKNMAFEMTVAERSATLRHLLACDPCRQWLAEQCDVARVLGVKGIVGEREAVSILRADLQDPES